MMKILKIFVAIVPLLVTGCIKETAISAGYSSDEQVAEAPGAFEGIVDGVTESLVGEFLFGSNGEYPWDFGYPSFYLQRDVLGQDIALEDSGTEWYNSWYQVSVGLGPDYLVCQVPWTYYYKWILNCNTVLELVEASSDPSAKVYKEGAGIAYAMRAMFYMDLARMFQSTYVGNEQAPTVPIVIENMTLAELQNNPRATNEAIWKFILEDLDRAEDKLAEYVRQDVYTPDLSVIYGLKARAYLTMENWPEAENYAKLAQSGYTPLTESEYLDRLTAFNTPNSSWIFGLTYKASDPQILENDSDSNWGSQMFLEVQGGLYGSAYGSPKRIDAHLYQTIPSTDFRKKCYVDPSLDAMSAADRTAALGDYSDYPELIDQAVNASASQEYGYLQLKFRAAGGVAGRYNPYLATVAAVPMMRVEEMMLIEAEAAGMQGDEGNGIALLTAFAQLRDPSYSYDTNSSFRDNVWWQRRVELWGEGFATFDIKRLKKGITRSYNGTNHPTGFRWNTSSVPEWMNLCIVRTEGDYNYGIKDDNNPTPSAPQGDSPEHAW